MSWFKKKEVVLSKEEVLSIEEKRYEKRKMEYIDGRMSSLYRGGEIHGFGFVEASVCSVPIYVNPYYGNIYVNPYYGKIKIFKDKDHVYQAGYLFELDGGQGYILTPKVKDGEINQYKVGTHISMIICDGYALEFNVVWGEICEIENSNTVRYEFKVKEDEK